jgi:hypothetical protein
MSKKKPSGKTKLACTKVLLASVTKEMAQPRIAQSAQRKTDRQINPKDGEPV